MTEQNKKPASCECEQLRYQIRALTIVNTIGWGMAGFLTTLLLMK